MSLAGGVGHERAHSYAEQDGATAERGRAGALASGKTDGTAKGKLTCCSRDVILSRIPFATGHSWPCYIEHAAVSRRALGWDPFPSILLYLFFVNLGCLLLKRSILRRAFTDDLAV